MLNEDFIPLDVGVIPSPSGAGALVLHGEEAADCLVVLMVHRPSDRARLAALATFKACAQSIFGYPNDEALSAVPTLSYGFYEARNSRWASEITAFNRQRFPETPDSAQRHFFMGCHDASGQFLAADLTVEVFEKPWHEVLADALRRIAALPPD